MEISRKCFGCGKKSSLTICDNLECRAKVEKIILGNYVVKKLLTNNRIYRIFVLLGLETLEDPKYPLVFHPFPAFLITDGKKNFEKLRILLNWINNNWKIILEHCRICGTDDNLTHAIGNDEYFLLKFIIMSNTKVFKRIQDGPVKIYKIKYRDGENFTGNLFYHGSPAANWFSILHNGIKNCSKTVLMRHGDSLGSGIYLAKKCKRSLSYSTGQKICVLGVVRTKSKKSTSDVYVEKDEKLIRLEYVAVFAAKTDKKIIETILDKYTF